VELARLFNLGTILTLTLAAAVSYVVLFAGTAHHRHHRRQLTLGDVHRDHARP
jgi:hypothetical protein